MTDRQRSSPPLSEAEKESQRILERVAQESETVGTSSTSRVAERVKDHLIAGDVEGEQWTEVWGTRIGRTLGLLFAIGLIIYLVQTYVLAS